MIRFLIPLVFFVSPAWTQHPPEHQSIHDKFYSSWNMPNNGGPRTSSCCNQQDCFPTPIRFNKVTQNWEAKMRDSDQWVPIPPSKLEELQPDPRESPDEQSHACMNASGHVYCAVRGSGG